MSTHSDDELVMLHGWGMNAAVWNGDWQRDWPELCQHRIELPGHGDSPFPIELNSLWRWADACLNAAPARAVWLGWSLGGLVALAAALRAPQRVAGLILLTATPRFVQAADWRPAMPETTLNQFHNELLADSTATLARFLALQVRGSDSARETLRQLREELATRPPPNAEALALGLELLREEDLRGQLPDIRCPALWLFGSHDALVPAAVAERVELLMPEAQTHIIAGAAHAPHLSHPMEFVQTVRSWLANVRESSA
ncbi:pimeloyl-[acyl-carrier protein] methyl ester esterase [Chromatium weissei]|nr:pimeloyl-[acyl-carrier protein] methyl ester esterase [Chromatium weissei]